MKKNSFILIFTTYILIILLGSVLIGLFSIRLFKYYLVNAAEFRMASNINLIKSNIEELQVNNVPVNFDYLAKKYSENIGSTVTFIDDKGNVIGERIKDSNKDKNFNNLSEIISAKQEGKGSNYFYNNELKVNILNIAGRIKTDKFNGYIHLSTTLNEIDKANNGLLGYVIAGVLFIFISSVLLKLLFEINIVKPLQDLTDNSSKIKEGNIESRVNIISDDIIGVMADEYNSMVDSIQSKIEIANNKRYRIENGLNNIKMGIIAIDEESRITYSNKFILKLFNFDQLSDKISGHKIIELIKDSKVNNIFKEVIESNQFKEEEVHLEDNNKILKLSAYPINVNSNKEKSIGCLAVFYDITQIKKMEQMGSDFVSNATHELRTPLTSIKGFVETLRNGAIEDKEVAERFLEIIDLECQRLNSLINDILQLAEIQNINQDTNLEIHYMQDIIPEVLAFLESQANKKEIKIVSEIQENMPHIFVNKNRIKQMLINLVDNAIKYTQAGGNVEVKAFFEGKKMLISVKDDGIGISEQSLSRLFERFYRVDKGRSRSQGGTGLGLSIVKHIVDLYGGTIDVKSQVGKGTEFIVTLPIKKR